MLVVVVLCVLLPGRVYAQTPTPTLTPTRTPSIPPLITGTPTATPTPASTPTPIGPLSTVLWGCLVSNAGGGPVCTWGDYFEIMGFNFLHKTEASIPSIVDWPGPEQLDRWYMLLLPPADTREIHATCTYEMSGQAYRAQSGAGSPSMESRVSFQIADGLEWGVGASGLSPDLSVIAGGGTVGLVMSDSKLLTYQVVWKLEGSVASWPAVDNFPSSATVADYAGFSARHRVAANVLIGNIAQAHTRVACQIDKIVRLDYSEYVPSSPTVGDFGTPTPPVTCYIGCGTPVAAWPTPVSWLPATPDPIEFGVTPGDTECFEPLPGGFASGSTTIMSNTLEVNIPAYEFCAEQYEFSLEFLGWNFGMLMAGGVTLGVFTILYGIFKKG